MQIRLAIGAEQSDPLPELRRLIGGESPADLQARFQRGGLAKKDDGSASQTIYDRPGLFDDRRRSLNPVREDLQSGRFPGAIHAFDDAEKTFFSNVHEKCIYLILLRCYWFLAPAICKENNMENRALQELWNQPTRKRSIGKLVYEILFVTVAVINYILLLFDALYLYKMPYFRMTMRDVLLRQAPAIVETYDSVKGIQPHRFTVAYENDYRALKIAFEDLATAPLLERPAREQRITELLASLTEHSRDMIDRRGVDSHFYLAEKDGVLEMVKNIIREHLPNEENSAKQAFAHFFSRENLTDERRADEFAFFEKEILPLMQENYFRWIGEDGEKTDYFYRIDRWFVLFFLVDFLFRWAGAIRGRAYRRWYLFPVHHFYEIVMLYPPHYSAALRLLRIIPIYLRMKRNRFIPDDGLMPNIIHDNAQIIAAEISGLVALNILDQAKSSLETSGRLNLSPGTTEAVEKLLAARMDQFSRRVMPEIEPQITEMVQYSINRAMEPYLLSPLGPVIRLVLLNVHATIREGLEAAFSGPEGTERLSRILQKATHELLMSLTDAQSQESLIRDITVFLDRFKKDLEEQMQR